MHSKNEKIILKIEDITPEGSGVGRAEDGYVLFVPGTAPGDTAGCTVLKAGRSYGYAKADSITEPSPHRTDPGCGAFGRCGGCALRHIGYDYELEIKGRWIAESFRRIGGFDIGKVNVRAPSFPDRYRNKAEYPAGTDREGRLRFGLYAPRSHRVVACTDCLLVPGFHRKIIAAAEDFCNSRGFSAYEDGKGGLIRHLYIRDARATGQTSVSLIVNGREFPDRGGFAAAVKEALPGVTSVSVIYNEKPGNVILGDRYETLYGSERITDRLCGLDFEISPLSFYQVNRDGAELLYGIAGEMLGDCPGTLIDLYCGIGTVGLSLAGRAGRLIGVEIIPQAVDDARRNAALNGTDNAEFICGDAAAAAEKLAGEGIKPSAVVIDPPRKGCAPSVIADIIKMSPEKIVMISCNHATGARDAALLCEGGYRLERIEGVDMFPRTGHVETVVLLRRKNIDDHLGFVWTDEEFGTKGCRATYPDIQAYIQEKYGFKVSNLNIAQIKRKCGIIERENYNLPKSENSRQAGCTEEKEAAIMDAFRHFQLI